jgi:uncharacterized protein (DUF433 family)
MAKLDWSKCPGIECVRGTRSGAAVFRGTRTPVAVVFDNLELGASIADIMDWYHLSEEQVTAVMKFGGLSVDVPPVDPPSLP